MKTLVSSGVAYAHFKKKVGMTNIVMCPSHLIHKWKAEIEKLVPNSKAYIVKDIFDLISIEHKIKVKIKTEHTFIIMSKESAKLSYELKPAVNYSISKKTFTCPKCGQKLQKKVKFGEGRDAYYEWVDFDKYDMAKEKAYNTRCLNYVKRINKESGLEENVRCGEKLWGPLNKNEVNSKWTKLGTSGWYYIEQIDDICNDLTSNDYLGKKDKILLEKALEVKEQLDNNEFKNSIKAPRKYSLAKYIRERYKGYIDYFIADELHLYKSGNSSQGQAMADIAGVAKKFIGATGTLLNGYADGLFYILYRTVPALMRKEGYSYEDEALFSRDFGVVKKENTFNFDGGIRGSKTNSSEKKLPGVSPIVFTKFLLENAVFLSLSDMDGGLPGYKEIPVGVEMDKELMDSYSILESDFADAASKYQGIGVKALGSLVQVLSTYPDMPYDQGAVLDPDTGKVIVEPINLDRGYRNKEDELLRLVKEKVDNGEKVLIYYEWTNKTDVAEKLSILLKENGIKAETLTSSVKSELRDEWIKKKVEEGIDVLLCNPKLVETGLDLLDFTNIIFYQIGYNIFTMRQASRRSWRLSQDKDIEVYFMYYKGTVQHKAIGLMATKLQASMAIEGKFSEEGLRAMSDNEDILTKIAESVVDGIKDTTSTVSFVSTERTERESSTTRKRSSLESLKFKKPSIITPDYLCRNSAINKNKISSHKTTLSRLLNLEDNIGNLL